MPNKRLIAALLCAGPLSCVSAQTNPLENAETNTATNPAKTRAMVERIAVLLAGRYVYAETGQYYAAMLRTNSVRGDYDGLEGKVLADRLTKDLLAVADDGHLRVRVTPSGPIKADGQPPKRRPRPLQWSKPVGLRPALLMSVSMAFLTTRL